MKIFTYTFFIILLFFSNSVAQGNNESILYDSILNNNFENFSNCLKLNTNVNFKFADGSTPLMIAAMAGRVDMMQILRKSGGDPLMTDQLSMNMLSHAAKFGQIESVRWITKQKFCNKLINSQNIFGKTPLHLAIQSANPELIEILLEAGADKNIKNKYGKLAKDYCYKNNPACKLLQ